MKRSAPMVAFCIQLIFGARDGIAAQEGGRAFAVAVQGAVETGAPFSTIQTVKVQSIDVSFVIARRRGPWSIEVPLTLVPLAVVRGNAIAETFFREGRWWIDRPERVTTYGLGAKPLGLQITRAGARFAPIVGTGFGVMWFDRPVPGANSSRWNVVVEIDAGLRVQTSRRVALEATYRLSHLSNAFTGEVNPGVDSHMLRLGVQYARRSARGEVWAR